jgi:hypothetical protein
MEVTIMFTLSSATIKALSLAAFVLLSATVSSIASAADEVTRDVKIEVTIRKGEKSLKETILCNLGPDGRTPIGCIKQSSGTSVSKEDIASMHLERLIPEEPTKFQTRHSYTNCSGPQLFHCDDVDRWVEECRQEYVCDPNGLIPDSCVYKPYCWNHWVHTHECNVVGTCPK